MNTASDEIPFVDLVRQHRSISDEVAQAMAKVIDTGSFIVGEELKLFEQEFAKYTDAKYAVGVGSGTDALRIALETLGIGPGDEVITVSHTFVATVYAIMQTGAKPVLVDIDPQSYTINTDLIEKAITPKTKALLPVHLYGQPANMPAIIEIARKYNLAIIEDSAQGHGAKISGKTVGSIGNIGCFSFYPAKNLGAYGDGGCIVTNDEHIAEKAKLLREYGQRVKYHHDIVGYNSRLDTLQAAILRIKLVHLDTWNEKRQKNAKLYAEALSEVSSLTLPGVAKDRTHVYHLYVIRTKQRDALKAFLAQNKISTGIHYPIPIHKQPAYLNAMKENLSLPVTEQVVGEILSLPMFPELRQDEVTSICDAIKRFYY